MKRFRKILWWSNVALLLTMTSVVVTSFFCGVGVTVDMLRQHTKNATGWNVTETSLYVSFGTGGMCLDYHPAGLLFASYDKQFSLISRVNPWMSGGRCKYPFQQNGDFESWDKEVLVKWAGFQYTRWSPTQIIGGTQSLTLPIGVIIPPWFFFTFLSVKRKWKQYRHDRSIRHGECPECGYVLNQAKRCSECGYGYVQVQPIAFTN